MLILKVIFSASLIGIISLLAKRFPVLGGYFAVFPIITFISLAMLAIEKQTQSDVSRFISGALLGVGITAAILVVMLLLVRHGVALNDTLWLGIAAWTLAAFLFTYVLQQVPQ